MLKNIGERIAEEMENSIARKILHELEKEPIENSLLIFDMIDEKPERVEVYTLDPKNILMLWKGFKTPDASIRAESKENVEKLLKFVDDVECSFTVPLELSKPLEKYKMNKEDWLFYTTDKKGFSSQIKHKVERLRPEPEYVEQISSEWPYFNSSDFIAEKMLQHPFFGIKERCELVSYAGGIAGTDKTLFLALAHTKENFRGRGMMKSITSALTEEAFRQKKVPTMYIVKGNQPSINSVEKLGFYSITTHVKFTPK